MLLKDDNPCYVEQHLGLGLWCNFIFLTYEVVYLVVAGLTNSELQPELWNKYINTLYIYIYLIPARTSPGSTTSKSGARGPGQSDEKWASGNLTRHR